MTEFTKALIVCPYCDSAKPRAAREIPANRFIVHRLEEHGHCQILRDRDDELIFAAQQRAFERATLLGDRVHVSWEEGECLLDAVGTVVVLGAGFFRVDVGGPGDSIRVPEYGCPGWSRTSCIGPAGEHVENARQVT